MGNDCSIMIDRADEIFDDIALLIDALNEDGRSVTIPDDIKQEILRRIMTTKELFILLGALFSNLGISNENITEQTLDELAKIIDKVTAAWHSLEPNTPTKLHCLIHAVVQAKFLKGPNTGGLGDYHEQWVEQIHQQGVKDRSRSKGSSTFSKAFNAHSRWEEIRTRPEVARIYNMVKDKRKITYKRKQSAAITQKQARKEAQLQKRKELIETFTKHKLPSAEEIIQKR